MKRLYLIRHAKSSWSNLKISDFDRPLNQRGKKEAPLMGQRLAQQSIYPDTVVSSSAKRARSTAEIIAKKVNFPVSQISYSDLAYTSDTVDLLQVVRKIDDRASSAFLVAHNYAITDLAVLLTSVYIKKIPTSGIVAMDLAIDSWTESGPGKGSMLFFDYPNKSDYEENR